MYILDPQLRTDPVTGRPCAYMAQTPGDPNSAAALSAETEAQHLIGEYGLCSNSPPVTNQPSPAMAAAEAFQKHVPLPSPTFAIPPGSSITGTRAYMQIGGPSRLDPDPINVFGYTVILHVTSSYDIDWGDGTAPTTNTTSQGGRYPDGDLWHVYQTTGTDTVVVTQHWTATYTINTTQGTIEGVLATSGSMQLPVRQAQAVIDG